MSAEITPEQFEALLNGPALKPPEGMKPNFVNPPNLNSMFWIIQGITLVLCTLFLAMRIYTRIFVSRRFEVHDYAITVAWAMFIGLSAVIMHAAKIITPGVNQWNVRLKELKPFLLMIYIGCILYGIQIFLIKYAILLQYLQIFVPGGTRNALFWACHALIWLNFLYYVLATCLQSFACSPIDKLWTPWEEGGHCINIYGLQVASSLINSVSDFAILVIPQFIIWKLQIPVKKKGQISLIFLIACIACASAVLKLAYSIKLYQREDKIREIWMADVWVLPEISFGIIVSCLPDAAKFCKTIRGSQTYASIRHMMGTHNKSGKSTSPSNTKESASQGYWQLEPMQKNRPGINVTEKIETTFETPEYPARSPKSYSSPLRNHEAQYP